MPKYYILVFFEPISTLEVFQIERIYWAIVILQKSVSIMMSRIQNIPLPPLLKNYLRERDQPETVNMVIFRPVDNPLTVLYSGREVGLLNRASIDHVCRSCVGPGPFRTHYEFWSCGFFPTRLLDK